MQKEFKDQEIMNDMLSSQKQVAGEYSTIALECCCPQLKKSIMDIFSEEQGIQTNVFQGMQQRNWYPTTPAEQMKVDEARTKFEGISQQLC